jgi:hypothetical protein
MEVAILQPKCGSMLRLSPGNHCETEDEKMPGKISVILYIVLMAAIIVAVDFLVFRNRFWARLMVNVGIVLVFAAFYWRFFKRP